MAAADPSGLPREIIEIILSKLSVKPLVRFKSVSKSWNTIISDPAFVRNHHHRSKNSNPENLFLRYDHLSTSGSNSFSVVKLGDRKLQTLRAFECNAEWNEYLCFCEGVILTMDLKDMRFILWNPCTRTQTKLSHWNCSPKSTLGLCRDPNADDFKVVIVSRDYYCFCSCKNKSWTVKKFRTVEHIPLGLRSKRSSPGVYVDGATYWLRSIENVTQILYFDPRDDELKTLQKPGDIVHCCISGIYLTQLRGCLCLYHDGRDGKTVHIWTKEKGMDNSSWKKLMIVENVEMPIWDFQPLCFIGYYKIVVRNRYYDTLLVYSSREKRFEEFEENSTSVLRLGLAPVPYMASLLLLEEKMASVTPQDDVFL